MVGRLPRAAITDPASMPGAVLESRPVALESAGRVLGLGQERVRQLRVLKLAENALTLAEAVVDELLHRLGRALRLAGLAHVLVDDHERLRGDRVGRRVGR